MIKFLLRLASPFICCFRRLTSTLLFSILENNFQTCHGQRSSCWEYASLFLLNSDSGRWPSQVYNGLSNSPKRSRPGDNNPVFQPWPTTITHVFHKVPDTCSCLNITFVRSLHTPVLPMFYCTKHIWNTAWPANFLSSWSVLGHHFWGTLQPHQIRTTSAICIFPYGTNTRKYQLHPTAKKTRTSKSSTFVQYISIHMKILLRIQ